MDPVYSMVLTWSNIFLQFMILILCLVSFHLDIGSQFVNCFSQNLTVFIGCSFKFNEDGSFTLGQFILISFTSFGFPSG